jgi:NADH-quinone oxidoreductase subunit A
MLENSYLNLIVNEYAKLGIFFIVSLFISCFILFLSIRLTIKKPDSEKLSTYECGFEPYEDARNLFDVRFYLVAILFLVFDLEAVYFFPWCVSFSVLNEQGFLLMLDFIFELLIGFIYAIQVGALDWE